MEMKDVLEMGQRLRNWGRWGSDDELGTLNFITAKYLQVPLRGASALGGLGAPGKS